MSEPVEAPAPGSWSLGAERDRARRAPDDAFHLASHASRLSARCTRSRWRRRSRSSRRGARYDAETRERLVDLFGEPERWGGAATRRAVGARRRARAQLHRRDGFDAHRCRAATTSSSPRPSTSTRWPTARCRFVPLQRHDPLPRRRGPPADHLRALAPGRALPVPAGRPGGEVTRLLPGGGGLAARRRHVRGAAPPSSERGLPSLDAAVADLLAAGWRRREATVEPARRLAALRGLRAVPVHARARPRTPRPRRSGSSIRPPTPRALPEHVRPSCASSACLHGRGRRHAPRCCSWKATGERHRESVEHRVELERSRAERETSPSET